MTKIAIISDTHNIVRPQVVEIIKTCDSVIHAGDFSDEKILSDLRNIRPVYAVRGNNDYGWIEPLPEKIDFKIEGLKFTVIHNRARLLSGFSDSDVIIFGHTHKYSEQVINGRLWLNPGSCGRRRMDYGLSMAVMTVDGDKYSLEKVTVV